MSFICFFRERWLNKQKSPDPIKTRHLEILHQNGGIKLSNTSSWFCTRKYIFVIGIAWSAAIRDAIMDVTLYRVMYLGQPRSAILISCGLFCLLH